MDTDTIREVYSAFVADACRADTDFARRMQKDCKEALSDLIGAPVADDVEISVVQNTPGLVHVAIPNHVCATGDYAQISEEEMAEVAGGEVIFVALISTLVGTGLVAAGSVAAGVIAHERNRPRDARDG